MKVELRSAPGYGFEMYQSCAGGYHGAMFYQTLSALVLIVHLGFILFVVAGAACPLTGLENHLRMLAGTAGYAGGFVDHYLVALIYPSGLTRTMQWGLAAAVLVVNAVLYARIVLAPDRPA